MTGKTRFESRSTVWVPGLVILIVLSFVGATVFVHWHMRAIDEQALHIAETAAPSIEHLATARGDLRNLQVLVGDEVRRLERREPLQPELLDDSRRTWNRSIDDYLILPALPGERAILRDVARFTEGLDDSITRYERAVERGDLDAARASLSSEIPAAIANLYDTLTSGMEVNAHDARDLALRIRDLRTRWSYVALVLDVVCAVVALTGGIVAHRIVRAHAELLESHRRLHEERATELDSFAGRVAHDILSPLNTIGLALHLAGATMPDKRRHAILERGNVALGRVKALVSGLLEFARAAGKPTVGTHTDLGKTFSEMRAELVAAAEQAGARLTIKPAASCFVACNRGVLTSLVSNLARNAIKHMGEASVRQIEIRAIDRGAFVRVEVEDTGPGVAPDLEGRIFEPYFRGPTTTQPGVGLGLATVKKLAEAHGGRVGLSTVSGKGSTFWFELPKAKTARALVEDAGLAEPSPLTSS